MEKQAKLVISHGERITEHNLADSAVVIGRDPQCDLFFADKKLSRRHARIEHVGSSFKLVDLGSRNGTWVNEVKVSEKILTAGDAVRLGGVRISFEPELDRRADGPPRISEDVIPPLSPSPDDSSTVMLRAEEAAAAQPPSSTVALAPGAVEIQPPEPPEPGDTGTVALSAPPVVDAAAPSSPVEATEAASDPYDEADETLERSEEDSKGGATVMLSAEAGDTGTVIYRDTMADPRHIAATRPLGSDPAADAASPALADPLPSVSAVSADSTATIEPGLSYSDSAGALDAEDLQNLEVAADSERMSAGLTAWSLKLTLLLVSYVVLAVVVLVWPLSRSSGVALHEESMLRGRALLELLVAENHAALASGELDALSLERVQGAHGAGQALILDREGNILAPEDRRGETLRVVEGIAPAIGEIRSFYVGRAGEGQYVLAQPFLSDTRPFGLAVLEFTSTKSGDRTGLILIVGSLLLFVGALATVWFGRRLAMSPIRKLAVDVEHAFRSGAMQLSPEREPSEVRELAVSLNAWADRVSGGAPGSGERGMVASSDDAGGWEDSTYRG